MELQPNVSRTEELWEFDRRRLLLFHRFMLFLQDGGLGNLPNGEPKIIRKNNGNFLASTMVSNFAATNYIERRYEEVLNRKYGFLIVSDKNRRVIYNYTIETAFHDWKLPTLTTSNFDTMIEKETGYICIEPDGYICDCCINILSDQ